ncbi:unnamed protein product [Choristocarpus tenellus]
MSSLLAMPLPDPGTALKVSPQVSKNNGPGWTSNSARTGANPSVQRMNQSSAGSAGKGKAVGSQFLLERAKRKRSGQAGSESATPGLGGRGGMDRTMTPAEICVLKTIGTGSSGGVGGILGLDRLMRVMVNALDVSVTPPNGASATMPPSFLRGYFTIKASYLCKPPHMSCYSSPRVLCFKREEGMRLWRYFIPAQPMTNTQHKTQGT